MAIPLLLTAGRMLLMGGARAAGGGAARGAIVKTFKQKAIDTAKDKAVSMVKGKVKKKSKKISAKKLLTKTKSKFFGNGGGGGGALVLRKSSAIVKSSQGALVKSEDKKPGGALVKSTNIRDQILQELEKIKVDVIKIKEISTQKLLNQKEESESDFIESRKKKAEEQEKNLEEKKDTKKKKKLGITAPKVGIFDMIKNFLLNVLIGSLLNFALHHAPTILKMFKEIGEGLTNTWNVLRLGIITLTTVFPRQVRTIASFTRKIIGPPAKLIGKLLLKAGNIAGNLFKKAGGVIFNLIKGPLTSLVKKVGGEALEQGARGFAKGVANRAGDLAKRGVGRLATRATLAVGGKNLVKRLAKLSKIFKRVPIVGALIGLGIDLALGEKFDRALAGAAGAAIGAGIGGALGKGGALALTLSTGGVGALAAPFIIGASGFLGSAIGDWAGKAIYDNLNKKVPEADKETTLEQRAYGGQVNVRGGSSRSLPRANTAVQRRTTSTRGLSRQTLDKAKGTLLKDEESAKRFSNLSSAYGAIPFVGEAMRLGLDVSLGERVSKSRTDAIAESIGSSIGMALKNDEFSVRGFNKRIIGEFSRNLTDWAKRKIFISVKSQESQFKSLQEKKKEEQKPGAAAPGGANDDGTSTPSSGASEGQWGPLLDLIAGKESGGNYEAMYPSTTLKGATKMTIAEVARRATGAVGKYQQLPQYLISRAKAAGLNPDKDLYSPRNQDLIITKVNIEGNRGGRRWLKGEMSDERFMQGLSQEFASLPNAQGKFYYPGQRSSMTPEKIKSALAKVKGGGNIPADVASKPVKNGGKGGGNGINRHLIPFLAMGGNHTVTSSMGLRNFALSPGMHMGVDIAGRRGEPLQAFTDGVVEATGYDGGYGNWVNWIDNKGIGHFYAHMDKKASVRAGQKIKKGTILGPLGNTGKSSGPHLHWEAATNPRDNGMPKSSVLSRFNPLSKYNKESPFGGSIQPDPSMASSSSDIASSPGAPGSSESQSAQISDFALNYKVVGAPAAAKGGRGGGNGVVSTRGIWDTGPGFTIQGAKDEQGRPVVFSKGAAEAFAKMMKDSGGKVRASDVSSSKRSPEKNRAVGGASRSLHMSGIAMDIHGSSNSWIRANGRKYGWIANDYPGSHGGHFEFKGAGLAPSGTDSAAPDSGSSPSSSGGAPTPPPEAQISDFALSYKVVGAPAKSSISNLEQTPSYNKASQTVMFIGSPGGQSMQPIRTSSGGYSKNAVSSVVNSYGMVSRQIISSSLYKL